MTICLQKCRKIRGLGCVNQARIRARVTQPSPRIYLHICRSRWDLFLLFGVSRVSIIWEALIRCPSRNFLQWKFDFNASSSFSSSEVSQILNGILRSRSEWGRERMSRNCRSVSNRSPLQSPSIVRQEYKTSFRNHSFSSFKLWRWQCNWHVWAKLTSSFTKLFCHSFE